MSSIMNVEAYDLCIIGSGMFGSAAARHASANLALNVCLIGPDEPNEEEKKSREILASYYDEGRMVNVLDNCPVSQVLAKHTIKSFRELEKLSGIHFYHPVGHITFTARDTEHFTNMFKFCELSKTCYVDLSEGNALKDRFPFLKFGPSSDYPFFDDDGAGYINPRKIVEAQKKVAAAQGCHIISDIVKEVKDLTDGLHLITTENGRQIHSKRVLFCTGALTNFQKFDIIGKLRFGTSKETAVMLRISEEERNRLSSMPTILIYRDNLTDLPSTVIGAYMLPPILYPDGHYYMKIGNLGYMERLIASSLEDIKDWYNGKGDPEIIEKLTKVILKIIPDLKIEEASGMACFTCGRPSYLPYIDRITPTVSVAVVGNGGGATVCDEVGRIAATLCTTGRWDSELPKSLFEALHEDE